MADQFSDRLHPTDVHKQMDMIGLGIDFDGMAGLVFCNSAEVSMKSWANLIPNALLSVFSGEYNMDI
jgi:hypothetical protein